MNYLQVAEEAAREAGALLRQNFGRDKEIERVNQILETVSRLEELEDVSALVRLTTEA